MKKLLLLPCLIVFAISAFAQQGVWIQKSAGFLPSSSGVRDIVAVDTNVIWMFAYDGDPNTGGVFRNDYSKSVDGGNTWTVGNTPWNTGTFDWSNLCALNADTAWALCFNSIFKHGGLLYKTTDGGANWTQQGSNLYTSTTDGFPNNVYFWNANDGVILGDPDATNEYEIYTSNDGGASWSRVDSANIPNPADLDEAAWTNHFQVIGDTIWFDTNEGRVYRSVDHGIHWTVGNTTLAIVPGSTPQQAIDICFTNSSYGIARYYDDGAMSNAVTYTTDGGDNWDTLATTGDLFGGDVTNVPGTSMMMVSTGISPTTNYTGTSYSTDGGATWTTVETSVQRGALAIADSLHMWCGGFTASATEGGVYKWEIFPTVACTDASITTGTSSANDTAVCDGETVTFTVAGAIGPESGYYSGIVWLISSADISGSADPLADPSVFGLQPAHLPASINTTQDFANDGSFIDGVNIPYGHYFWTPVFFGNATIIDPLTPFTGLNELTLDPACTYTGNSVPVWIYAPNDINCATGITEVSKANLSVKSFMRDQNALQVNINSLNAGKAVITVMDLTGRVVVENNTSVDAGSNARTIDASALSQGTYVVKVKLNGNEAANKIVKY